MYQIKYLIRSINNSNEKDNKRNKDLIGFNPETNAYYQYDLYAMIVHGGTMNGGHYVSYVKWKQEFKIIKNLN